MGKKLTPKQARFVREYLIDLNQKQAAVRAGYSPRSARYIACELMDKPEIVAAIAKQQSKDLAKFEVTREQVLRELVAVGMADIRKLFDEHGNLRPLHELDDQTAASIAAVESEELYAGRGEERAAVGVLRKVKRFDKTKALELLGRHLGLWNDPPPPEHVGPGMTVIVQTGVQTDGQRVVAGTQVHVSLPPPSR